MKEPKNMKNNLSITPSRTRATIILAISGYINTGIVIVQGLLLVPLYLNYIGSHTYGLWLASGGILGMLALVNFGVSTMIIQRVSSAYGQQDYLQAGAYFINGVIVYLGICLLYVLIGVGVSLWVPDILRVQGDESELFRHCFQIALLAMTLSIINECMRGLAQALLRPLVPMISMASGRIIGIGSTVWMLFNGFGLWALPTGIAIGEGVIFILNLFYSIALFRKLGAQLVIDKKIIKEYTHSSPALLTARLGTAVSHESEPLLITLFLSPEVTTAYMITRRAADIVSQMLSVVYGATHSAFSNLVGFNRERARKVAEKLITIVFLFGLIGFVAYVGLNDKFISLWVGQSLSLNQNIIFLIGMGFFIRSFRDVLWQTLNGWGDFIYSSYVILSEGCLRLILMIIFLNIFGVVGVPLALLLSSLGGVILLWIRLKKYLSWGNGLSSIFRPLVTVIMFFCISIPVAIFIPNSDSWMIFIVTSVLLLVILFLLFIIMNWRMCRSFFLQARL